MSFLSFLSNVISPVTTLIGKIVTREEDKLLAEAALAKMENEIAAKIFEYEKQLLEAQSKIVIAEAQGQSFLQRSWRPLTMLTFLVLVVADSFGLTTFRLAPEAWTLLQIGLGGYVIGRSAEKLVPHLSRKS